MKALILGFLLLMVCSCAKEKCGTCTTKTYEETFFGSGHASSGRMLVSTTVDEACGEELELRDGYKSTATRNVGTGGDKIKTDITTDCVVK